VGRYCSFSDSKNYPKVGVENCGISAVLAGGCTLEPEIVPPLWWPVVPGSLVYLQILHPNLRGRERGKRQTDKTRQTEM
jgi:hypothetical protein